MLGIQVRETTDLIIPTRYRGREPKTHNHDGVLLQCYYLIASKCCASVLLLTQDRTKGKIIVVGFGSAFLVAHPYCRVLKGFSSGCSQR